MIYCTTRGCLREALGDKSTPPWSSYCEEHAKSITSPVLQHGSSRVFRGQTAPPDLMTQEQGARVIALLESIDESLETIIERGIYTK